MLFAGVAAAALGLSNVVMLPTRSLGIGTHHTPDYPLLKLPEATHYKKGHARGTMVLSLDRENQWVVPSQGRVEDLEEFLARWAEAVRDAGRIPGLRVRIAGHAPARYCVTAAMLAEELGYNRLLVAVYAPE